MAAHFDEVWDDEGCNQMCDTCRHAIGVLYVCVMCFHGPMCQPSIFLMDVKIHFFWLLPHPDFTTVDITQYAKQVVQILELAASMDEKLTPLKLVEAWMGKGPAKRRKMIQTTTLSRLEVETVIVWLLLQGYLRWAIIHSVRI